MSTTTTIVETSATGEDIEKVIAKIEPALEGVPRSHALIACVSLALVLQEPSISPENLQNGVKEVTRYMCLLLDGADMLDEEAKRLMN